MCNFSERHAQNETQLHHVEHNFRLKCAQENKLHIGLVKESMMEVDNAFESSVKNQTGVAYFETGALNL